MVGQLRRIAGGIYSGEACLAKFQACAQPLFSVGLVLETLESKISVQLGKVMSTRIVVPESGDGS